MGKNKKKTARDAELKRIDQVTKGTDLLELRSRKATAKARFTRARHQLLTLLDKEILYGRENNDVEEKESVLRNSFNDLLEILSTLSSMLKETGEIAGLEKATEEIEKAEEEYRCTVDRMQEIFDETKGKV